MISAYKTINENTVSEFEEKKSKFITHLAHVETDLEAAAFIDKIKNMYPDARHHCYAYILNENNRVKYSDDGEPQKTAGLPILSVLEGAGLKDVIAVVVRYFGGTLLGTGGLVRAYSKGAKDALSQVKILEIQVLCSLEIQTPYAQFEQTKFLLEQFNTRIDSIEYSSSVCLKATLLERDKEMIQAMLQELFSGEQCYSFSKAYTGVF